MTSFCNLQKKQPQTGFDPTTIHDPTDISNTWPKRSYEIDGVF